jgi:hypothetical protein
MWGCIAEATEADEDEQNSRSHRRHPTHAGARSLPNLLPSPVERPAPLKPTCAQPTPQNGRQATGRTSSSPGFVKTR